MRSQLEQNFHDALMTLVDAAVKRRLTPFVSGVDVGAARSAAANQQIDHRRFIPKSGVMNRPISVFIFDFKIAVVSVLTKQEETVS